MPSLFMRRYAVLATPLESALSSSDTEPERKRDWVCSCAEELEEEEGPPLMWKGDWSRHSA